MDQTQYRYLGTAVFFLGVAWGLIKWVGRSIREQLGPGMPSSDDAPSIAHADTVPPALVKQAIERGLVTAAQLASMKPAERQFLFASLAPRLAAPSANFIAAGGDASKVRRTISGAEFGMAALPANVRLHVHCPLCGELLDLPAFSPYVGHCTHCSAKTSVREAEEGHLLLHVAPGQGHVSSPGQAGS